MNSASSNLDRFANVLETAREELLRDWRKAVCELPAAAKLDAPTLDDHIPTLLDELVGELRLKSDDTISGTLGEGSAPSHGLQRVVDKYEIQEVVAEYNILRECIHDLADRNGVTLQGKPFRIFNRVFDHAIGQALMSYTEQRTKEVAARRDQHLAFVAHDLRTPLSAIALSGMVLEQLWPQGAASGDSHHMWGTLRRNVDHLESLVEQILHEHDDLDTKAGVKPELRDFELWPLVERVVLDLRPVAGTGDVRLINEVPHDLRVHADARLLRRIFQNLVANAIRYTPHGHIAIRAQVQPASGVIECWVKDNGEGIEPQRLPKVFEKGEADPDNPEATGLGLAIVKSFVEAGGGRITAESKPGLGSTFRFTIPNPVREPAVNGAAGGDP